MSSHAHEKLSAAANDRKARLAQLKSLKRKQAPESDASEHTAPESTTALARTEPSEQETLVTASYLSGRNFDHATRNVKLGFEEAPIGDKTQTLEYKAEQLALESKKQQEEEKAEDKPLDLFKLQPKKPNWDLKRDLEAKMKPLEVQTENAIAQLVRDRVESQKKEKQAKEDTNGEKQEVGMEGSELVEAMHLKEREEEEERRREAEDDDNRS